MSDPVICSRNEKFRYYLSFVFKQPDDTAVSMTVQSIYQDLALNATLEFVLLISW